MKTQSTSTSGVRAATGPRTNAGKRRSSRNALKHGIFSQHLILQGERLADFEKLHLGLRESFHPEGAMEELLVQQLSSLVFRSARVLAAETAITAKSPLFVGAASQPSSNLPNQYLLRAGLTDGEKVPVKIALLQVTMRKLFKLCSNIRRRGFDFIEDLQSLSAIYGKCDIYSDQGLCGHFVLLMLRSFQEEDHDSETTSKEDFAELAIDLIEKEMGRICELLEKTKSDEVVFNSLASLIPQQADVDRIIRYESHLSREFDRKLNQLERLQRARRGHPPASTIELDLD